MAVDYYLIESRFPLAISSLCSSFAGYLHAVSRQTSALERLGDGRQHVMKEALAYIKTRE